MKKISVLLSLAALLVSVPSFTASAAVKQASSRVAAAYPRNDYFDWGFADGIAFLEYEASLYSGTTTYKEHADAELAVALQNEQNAVPESDDFYYWYGYRIAIQQKRGNY
ncbi:hypothetical protein MUN81_15395 [Hymenobacter sp. 5317J-9]|uniref:hypothetical protein n=1 Tax=Hymenobacter sp. 5317J-9 TaxID=2932250 RepID=UPI001FD6C590|nr:hypothetical protein [Hymenobacter sp. 5317J-9]UOQ96620.1 hypothetical protein MUN81_15395 [Hymenobacter sp. 5317J-9]